jgi:glyoxylase-like metal-dependent hydrolase (beta-lactamase superfamily II)
METITVINTGPLGVNTYIIPIAEGHVLIVDPAGCTFSYDETKITDWLKDHHKTPAGIFITHGHFDHITGISAIKKNYPECPTAIHTADARALGSTAVQSQISALRAMGLERLKDALLSIPSADITFSGGETLGGVFKNYCTGDSKKDLSQWKIIHTPGHSAGSVCLYNEWKKELVSGDTLFYHSYGRTDLGGNEAEMMQSLTMLRKTIPPDTIVYPGHDYYGFMFADAF